MKSHHRGSRITFSHKKTKHTFKPNIAKKKIYSEVLDKSIKMWVSTHAMKCIQKKGGLDEYLLETQPKKIGSKFGMFLRNIIENKKKDENYEVPKIPFQNPQPKRKTSYIMRIKQG